LQCQNNMKLVFRISEDDSEIELIHIIYANTLQNVNHLFLILNEIIPRLNSRAKLAVRAALCAMVCLWDLIF
jgi:hypothetical protein